MLRGAGLVIDKLENHLITTSSGDLYKLFLTNDHINLNHLGRRPGDTLIVVTPFAPTIGTLTKVTIDGGCGCDLVMSLESLAGGRSSD